jgi:molecular chaperone IbpA
MHSSAGCLNARRRAGSSAVHRGISRTAFAARRNLEKLSSAPQMSHAVANVGAAGPAETPLKGFAPAIRKPCCSTGEHLMRHVDFSPLYRSTVGFDRLFTMLDSLAQPDGAQTYPPYNIERTGEDSYRISMAVAGFSDEEISIEAHRNVLTVKGERKDEGTGEGSELLYRGIASRAFERRFQLADHVEVVGASLRNGLLFVDLKRNIPEELKPRKIAITASSAKAKQIEAKTAA